MSDFQIVISDEAKRQLAENYARIVHAYETMTDEDLTSAIAKTVDELEAQIKKDTP